MNKAFRKPGIGDRSLVDETIARIAHQYYVLGLTQGEIAKRLGITRFKAHRMLAQARERGMVRIEIDVPFAGRLDLESHLAHRFNLRSAFICPAESTTEFPISDVIGHYGASVVAGMLTDGMTIAVSWGTTLRALAVSIEPEIAQNLAIVPLIGSFSKRSAIDKYEAATVLAQRLGAECYYLPAPILCDSVEAKTAISTQPAVQHAIEIARDADIALLSIGGQAMSSIRESNILSEEEYHEATSAGAVGNFLGRFIGANGAPIDHPLNQRCIGLELDAVSRIPTRVLCAGGETKVDVIAAILRRGMATALITDENTANELVSK